MVWSSLGSSPTLLSTTGSIGLTGSTGAVVACGVAGAVGCLAPEGVLRPLRVVAGAEPLAVRLMNAIHDCSCSGYLRSDLGDFGLCALDFRSARLWELDLSINKGRNDDESSHPHRYVDV